MAGKPENVYAEALFELAEEENNLDCIAKEIETVSKIMRENADFVKLLSSPTVSLSEKRSMLSKAFEGKVCDTVFNFLNVLCDNGRIGVLCACANRFKEMYNEKNNILCVTAVVSGELSENLKEKLTLKLESISGKRIILEEQIDKSIMGGIVLKYNNTQLDASVKTRLDNMRRQIDSIIA